MQLSEDQLLIQSAAKRFASEQLAPGAAKRDKAKCFPTECIQAMAKLGFLGLLVPENLGGTDVGYVSYALVLEEIAAADASCSTIMAVHNSVANLPILHYGTAQQQTEFLTPMAHGQLLGCFCLTEPSVGSDAAQLSAKASYENEHYLLNGTKQFITAGDAADIAIVFAVTDPNAGKKGISAFIVPTNTPGYQVSKKEDKMGQHAATTVQIQFDNCRIPEHYMLGTPGEGLKIALGNLECGRIGIAAQAIGMARAALHHALTYSHERHTFGKKLFDHQAVRFKLAEMATNLSAARALTLQAANLKALNKPCLQESSMAKLFATETALDICSKAIDIFGGYGYVSDFPVERIYRDVRVTTIYEGTSDVQKMVIARTLDI